MTNHYNSGSTNEQDTTEESIKVLLSHDLDSLTIESLERPPWSYSLDKAWVTTRINSIDDNILKVERNPELITKSEQLITESEQDFVNTFCTHFNKAYMREFYKCDYSCFVDGFGIDNLNIAETKIKNS